MDYTLIGLKNTYCFLDDTLIASKRLKEEHENYTLNCAKQLDRENLRINLPKWHFSKLELHWLGNHILQLCNSPLESKTSAILALEAPNTPVKLRSVLGSVHYISEFFPNLAQVSHPLRRLLKNHLILSGLRYMKIVFLNKK